MDLFLKNFVVCQQTSFLLYQKEGHFGCPDGYMASDLKIEQKMAEYNGIQQSVQANQSVCRSKMFLKISYVLVKIPLLSRKLRKNPKNRLVVKIFVHFKERIKPQHASAVISFKKNWQRPHLCCVFAEKICNCLWMRNHESLPPFKTLLRQTK